MSEFDTNADAVKYHERLVESLKELCAVLSATPPYSPPVVAAALVKATTLLGEIEPWRVVHRGVNLEER